MILDEVRHGGSPPHDPAMTDMQHCRRHLVGVGGEADHVEVIGVGENQLLRFRSLSHGLNPIAKPRSTLVIHCRGSVVHGGLKIADDGVCLAGEEAREAVEVRSVGCSVDGADAWTTASADVEQQARAP